jgi:hypothetical protein
MARIPSGTVKQFRKMRVDANVLAVDGVDITATPAEINNAADASARVLNATAAGAVSAGIQSVELNSVAAITMTMDATEHPGLFVVKHKSSSGGQNHFLNLTAGTWNGTNTVAKLDAANEALAVYFDSAGNGTVLVNVGSVSLG